MSAGMEMSKGAAAYSQMRNVSLKSPKYGSGGSTAVGADVTCVAAAFWTVVWSSRRSVPSPCTVAPSRLPDGPVKTRTLLILALVTGLAIVAAGAVQIYLAR